MRKPIQQFEIVRCPCQLDRVALALLAQAPPVEHDEHERSGGRHDRAASWRMASRPAYRPVFPSASSMRSSWLYFATRSVRLADPVLIWPALVATARSAIVTSSVSPERCETMHA